MKPVVGISCSMWAEEGNQLLTPGLGFDHGKRDYARMIAMHGGVPMFLPNIDDESLLHEMAAEIDGLLLTGGNDIDPKFYNQDNQYPKSVIHTYRDRVELTLTRMAHGLRRPIFGICRGHQLINVAFGGDLYQDSSLRPQTGEHSTGSEVNPVWHHIRIDPGSHLGHLTQFHKPRINSTHHQHLRSIAPGFRISAKAQDGVVEAMERIGAEEYILSVQWHPELLPDDPLSVALFGDFIQACRAMREM